MGGQLDGLLSHWQPAFANKLMMMMMMRDCFIYHGRKYKVVSRLVRPQSAR